MCRGLCRPDAQFGWGSVGGRAFDRHFCRFPQGWDTRWAKFSRAFPTEVLLQAFGVERPAARLARLASPAPPVHGEKRPHPLVPQIRSSRSARSEGGANAREKKPPPRGPCLVRIDRDGVAFVPRGCARAGASRGRSAATWRRAPTHIEIAAAPGEPIGAPDRPRDAPAGGQRAHGALPCEGAEPPVHVAAGPLRSLAGDPGTSQPLEARSKPPAVSRIPRGVDPAIVHPTQ
jgi:hypothetical protein